MPSATYTFPKGFLWGTATSSYQVEGNNTGSNWSAWEDSPGRIIQGQKSGKASDWWGGRWRDDLDRAAEAGQNAHRLSIEWSRVQPAPDRWNEDALDKYREILRGMLTRGITPMVTLHHFTDPLWISEKGGWESEDTPARFETYVRKTVDALRDLCTLWVTINEPNVYTYSGYLSAGEFPPGKNDLGTAFRVMSQLLRGHALAYRAIKTIQKEARVGIAQHFRMFRPARGWFPLDAPVARALHQNFNASFLDGAQEGVFRFVGRKLRIPEAAGTQDFIGINYYTTDNVRFNLFMPMELFGGRRSPAGAALSDGDYIANVPEGLFEAIEWCARRYVNLPILITENGVNDAGDVLRPRYLAEHLHQMWKAIQYNYPIKGYFHWSLVDNFEWERGWTQRFGLWGLDIETQARIRRPSVDLYERICKENALSHAAVEQYAPDALARLFPTST